MSKYIPDEDRDEIFKKLKTERANQFCAECGTPHPQWASATLGIFICYQCSGLHRSFGVHLSFVRSLNMDSWTPKQIYIMEHGGNQRFLEYSKSKGIPQGSPSSMKYSARAFEEYRKMLSSEADAALGGGASSQQRSAPRRAPQQQQTQPQQQQPQQARPEKKKEDPLDGWEGWGDMEATLAAIEKKQRSTPNNTPRNVPQRSVSQPRSATPQAQTQRSVTPPLSSASSVQRPKSRPSSNTPDPKTSGSSMDSLDGWSGWGDTESSLAEIERKQQQQQNQNQKNMAMYGNTGGRKKYESLSSEDYFASQNGGVSPRSVSPSSYQGEQPQRTFQAYGQSSGSSYQQGGTPAFSEALSSGWSKISSFAKVVAQTTTKAVHDSGLYDAVQGFMNGTSGGQGTGQKSSLLNDQSESSTPRQQYSSSTFQQSSETTSVSPRTKTPPPSSSPVSPTPVSQPQPRFVGPTAASQGLKPATGVDDEFNELVHGGMSNSRGARASRPGSDGPLCDDLPDVDAWLDSTLAKEAAKQASSSNNTSPAMESSPSRTESATAETKTEEAGDSKDGELGDDWDTW